MAAASFTWCGHQGEGNLKAFGPQGLPFYGDVNPYAPSALQVDILSDVMNKEITFYAMTPSDSLLSGHDTTKVWCLSKHGNQYLVFTANGSPFKIRLAAGQYNSNQWMNTKTGAGVYVDSITASENEIISFTPPDATTDWILIIRTEWEQILQEESNILSAETDTSGLKVNVNCNDKIIIPDDYTFGFTLNEEGSTTAFSITNISVEASDSTTIMIELDEPIIKEKTIFLSYSGTLRSTGSTVLASIIDLPVKNNSNAKDISGISDNKMLYYTVFPNPCSEYVNINSDVNLDMIRIIDLTGRLVFESKNSAKTEINISTEEFQQGMYLIYLTSENINSVVKLTRK
jgi:hypothetical protein